MKKNLFTLALLLSINYGFSQNVNLNIRALIQGFYIGGGMMHPAIDPVLYPSVCDTLTIKLLDTAGTYSTLYSASSVISTNGYGSFDFPNLPHRSYFIQLVHRNALTVFSKYPVRFDSAFVSYDFTALPLRLCNRAKLSDDGYALMYSGDVNQDGLIDVNDLNELAVLAGLFIWNYSYGDINGDGTVDGYDFVISENNFRDSVSAGQPNECAATGISEASNAIQDVFIFPNPFGERISISFRSREFSQNGEVYINNPLGQKIFSKKIRFDAGKNELSLELGSLRPGIYFLNIRNDHHEFVSRKLIKR